MGKKTFLAVIALTIFLCGCNNAGLNKTGTKKVADEETRAAKFFNTYFDDGKYLLKFRSWSDSGEDMSCVMGVDGDNYYLEYETTEGKQVLFVKDNKSYGILDELKSYVVEDVDENAKMQEDFHSKDIIGKTYEVCEEKIGDITYQCEKFTEQDGEENHYCFEEDKLKYIITKMDDAKVYLEIISVSDEIPKEYFEIPEGYEKIEYWFIKNKRFYTKWNTSGFYL